ncbi:30S ribosomal protein S20 [Candidatus Megaera venefica]|uniref:Small ribosomal subunit protein bS20 n=1 Tax=Candidatus Megaera venefica TaxID=2055910 RepID=A0ABU5NAJ5_9RICK|nr:30S ribosomal protein S20 [Candidatus Megaera venefica]
MANHSSTKKAIRKTERNTEVNKNRKSRIKTYIKKVLAAVDSGSPEEAKKALIVAQSEIMRGVACKLIQKNTASRKVSRLSARVKDLMLNPQEAKKTITTKPSSTAAAKKSATKKASTVKKAAVKVSE